MTDRQRIDWLEKFDNGYHLTFQNGSWYAKPHGRGIFKDKKKAKSLRDAIDKAIKMVKAGKWK